MQIILSFTNVYEVAQGDEYLVINQWYRLVDYLVRYVLVEGLSDAALKSMYNSSVMIPAVLFLLVFLILRFMDPLSKKEVAALQVKKDKVLGKA